MNVLARIKRLALSRRIILTVKAEEEIYLDGLTEDEVIESIVNAPRIEKTLRSRSHTGERQAEILYVLRGRTYSGILVYTKGKIVKDFEQEQFYILISSKKSL